MITVSDTNDIVRVPRTPQEAADQLAKSLDSNTKALNAVRRRYRLTLALIVVVVFTLAFVIKSDHDGDLNVCHGTNEVREQSDAKWDSVSEFLERLGVGNDPDEVAEREFLVFLTNDLEKQDCSDIRWFGN